MVTFEQAMNVIVPGLVLIVFGYLIMRPFFNPMGELIGWVKGIVTSIRGGDKSNEEIYGIDWVD